MKFVVEYENAATVVEVPDGQDPKTYLSRFFDPAWEWSFRPADKLDLIWWDRVREPAPLRPFTSASFDLDKIVA